MTRLTRAHGPEPAAGRRTAVLVVMCLALAVVVGMLASLLVAVPDMARDLRATETQVQWIMNAYGVTFAGLLLAGGALGDRCGRKGTLLTGLALFGAASLAVLPAGGNMTAVILLRGLAGVGAALVMPMTLSVIVSVHPPESRGRAVGIWSGVSFGSALLAVLLAGGLLEVASWRAVFVANAALAAVALLASALLVPASRRDAPRGIDVPGALLSVAGIGALVFGIVEGPELGWTHGAVLAGFVLGALVLTAFVLWELRTAEPLLDPRIFRLRGVAAGSLVLTAETLALFGFFFLGLQYLQTVMGYSPFRSGLALVALAAGAMVFSPVAPGLARRHGLRAVMSGGMLLIAAGLAVLALVVAEATLLPFLCATALIGAGLAFAATPATETIVAALPPERQGVASALNDLTRELGGVLGIAVLGSVFNATYRDRTEAASAGLPADAARAARDSLAGALRVAGETGGAPGSRLAAAAREAFNSGTANALWAGVAVVAAGTAAAWLLLLRGGQDRRDARPPAPVSPSSAHGREGAQGCPSGAADPRS